MDDPGDLWTQLPPEIRDQIDTHLRRRQLIHAIFVLREQSGVDPKPSLPAAQDITTERLRQLISEGSVEPEPSTTVEDLLAKARAIPGSIAAIEAVWDGDSEGWFVVLLAIVERPGPRHERFDEAFLAILRRGGDIRIFNGQVPPWPESAEATEKGTALAAAFGVPFHFASPSEPDHESPRWWDAGCGERNIVRDDDLTCASVAAISLHSGTSGSSGFDGFGGLDRRDVGFGGESAGPPDARAQVQVQCGDQD